MYKLSILGYHHLRRPPSEGGFFPRLFPRLHSMVDQLNDETAVTHVGSDGSEVWEELKRFGKWPGWWKMGGRCGDPKILLTHHKHR